MIFCNLGSGSKGNCTYLRHQQGAILIDQGFSLKTVEERFACCGLNPRDVAAIIVSHEHGDHIKGIGIFARRYHVPVYLTEATYAALPPDLLKKVSVRFFESGKTFAIEDCEITPFHIPHDAADPVGFVVTAGNKRAAIVTDLGSVSQAVLMHIKDLDLLLLEANHDLRMLLNGPYPLDLKHRIRSRVGHLSNEQSLELFQQLNTNGRLKHLILGHLSEINNQPQIVEEVFCQHPACRQLQVTIASQATPTPIIEL